jgi:hypothetical protein
MELEKKVIVKPWTQEELNELMFRAVGQNGSLRNVKQVAEELVKKLPGREYLAIRGKIYDETKQIRNDIRAAKYDAVNQRKKLKEQNGLLKFTLPKPVVTEEAQLDVIEEIVKEEFEDLPELEIKDTYQEKTLGLMASYAATMKSKMIDLSKSEEDVTNEEDIFLDKKIPTSSIVDEPFLKLEPERVYNNGKSHTVTGGTINLPFAGDVTCDFIIVGDFYVERIIKKEAKLLLS